MFCFGFDVLFFNCFLKLQEVNSVPFIGEKQWDLIGGFESWSGWNLLDLWVFFLTGSKLYGNREFGKDINFQELRSIWNSKMAFLSSGYVLKIFETWNRVVSGGQKLHLFFFNLFIFNWRIIASQYCVGFYQTSTFTFHKRQVRGYMDYESQMFLFTNPSVKH